MTSNRLLIPSMITVCAAISLTTFAQDETDALRYSQQAPQGTARSMGFGNALGSVGGDITSLSVNPAGIGIYRSSEVLFTPVMRFNHATGTYLGESASDNNSRFNVNNIGVVFTSSQQGRRYEKSDWKSFSFALGMNRLADYNRNYTYSGVNSGSASSSASEVFAIDATGFPERMNQEGTPAWFGYQSYLIDSVGGGGSWYTNVPWNDGIRQQRNVKERGRLNEYFLSFGGNYREQLMLGMTVGIPSISYTREASYTETDFANYSPVFDNYTMSERLTTSGIGINAKLGFIYKPVDQFRIGASLHTPTAYAMSDVYEQSLLANTEGYADYGDAVLTSPRNEFNYALTTPWRGVVSGTAMMGKLGFFSVDYEYVDYRSARYRFRTDDVTQVSSFREYGRVANQAIRDAYRAASNIRAGVEVRVQPLLLRAGFGFYGSPYKQHTDANRLDFSAGLGFRFDQSFFMDLGFRHSRFENKEQPYVLPAGYGAVAPTATLKHAQNNVALTLGFKF